MCVHTPGVQEAICTFAMIYSPRRVWRPSARMAPATEFKHTTACSDVEGPGGFYPGPENRLNTDFEKEREQAETKESVPRLQVPSSVPRGVGADGPQTRPRSPRGPGWERTGT